MDQDETDKHMLRLRAEFAKLDDATAIEPYIEKMDKQAKPFKYLAGAKPPKSEILEFSLSNKALYFAIALTTPGGTVFNFQGRWGGRGLDDVEMMEMYSEQTGNYELDDDFFESDEFIAFQRQVEAQRESSFREYICSETRDGLLFNRASNGAFSADLSLNLDVSITKRGYDLVDADTTADGFNFPAFEW